VSQAAGARARSVRAGAVVMVDVDAEHVFEVAAAEDRQPVEALTAHVRTKRSAWAFALPDSSRGGKVLEN
jgi:hypothetical protein